MLGKMMDFKPQKLAYRSKYTNYNRDHTNKCSDQFDRTI